LEDVTSVEGVESSKDDSGVVESEVDSNIDSRVKSEISLGKITLESKRISKMVLEVIPKVTPEVAPKVILEVTPKVAL
jgi:hypothetical protein